MVSAWQSKPSRRAMASVVVESSPPLSKVTAGRSGSDTAARPPDQDVQARREAKAVTTAPADHAGHQRLLLGGEHPERHQQDAIGGQSMPGLDREHLVDVSLVADDELE